MIVLLLGDRYNSIGFPLFPCFPRGDSLPLKVVNEVDFCLRLVTRKWFLVQKQK